MDVYLRQKKKKKKNTSLPWALLARARGKLRVDRLVGGHGGAVHVSLGRLVVVHSEGRVLVAVDARLIQWLVVLVG